MRLINADKLIEKLSANLDNPEEFPVIDLGTVMRMIANEEEVHPSQPVIDEIGGDEVVTNSNQEVSTWEYKADGLYSCKCGARMKPEDVYKSFYCYHCGAKKYVEDKTGMKHILTQRSGKIENVNARGITG